MNALGNKDLLALMSKEGEESNTVAEQLLSPEDLTAEIGSNAMEAVETTDQVPDSAAMLKTLAEAGVEPDAVAEIAEGLEGQSEAVRAISVGTRARIFSVSSWFSKVSSFIGNLKDAVTGIFKR
jgi:hypothetical protein